MVLLHTRYMCSTLFFLERYLHLSPTTASLSLFEFVSLSEGGTVLVLSTLLLAFDGVVARGRCINSMKACNVGLVPSRFVRYCFVRQQSVHTQL